MAGRVQLETSGSHDRFFTIDPDYTHFIQSFKKHSNYSVEHVYLDPKNEADFGKKVKFVIPQNQGDILKTLSVKMKLPALNYGNAGYIESIGHALIEYADIIIGGEVVQRIPSDYLQIYSEHNVTQTKQKALEKLIGKYSLRTSAVAVANPSIIGFLGSSTTEEEYFVDIPFYFYNNPELAIPLCAITKQEIEIEIKLRDHSQVIIDATTGNYITLNHVPKIVEFQLYTEIVFVDICERVKLKTKKRDYTITQIQQNIFDIDQNVNSGKFKLSFINPVKELYFVIQRQGVTPFDYDNTLTTSNNKLILYENLKHLDLTFDGEAIITEETGNPIILKAVQGAIHHSKTQLFRRFYSYSFACEPERWYPTGQVNMSIVKEQILSLSLTPCANFARQVRVYALSYNILRVNGGITEILFNS
jgi:hypothetical protein|tara:strand:+ start:2256 stop:3509 length:1254 start_codon:yes stop_codon:yes gene_type:complete